MSGESRSAEFIFDKVNTTFPEAILETVDFRGEQTLIIEQSFIKDICLFLRDDEELRFDFLEDIVADDMLPKFPRFAVNYHIYSIPCNHRLRLRVPVEDPDDGPDTVGTVWQIGTWQEI